LFMLKTQLITIPMLPPWVKNGTVLLLGKTNTKLN
jgi:hypothetical protein